MTNRNPEPNSARILIEYVNDWLAPTGGIYPSFPDREQVDGRGQAPERPAPSMWCFLQVKWS